MNNTRAFEKLKQLVAIPSVSTDATKFDDLIRAAKYIEKELDSMGFEVDMYQKDNCPPLIVGKKNINPDKPTIAVYAHYDVQPEAPVDKWSSSPFVLTLRNGKIYGRGVADDKGHLIQSIVAAKNLIDQDKLRNNIVFIFEGEEETGSVHFEELVIKDLKSLQEVDAFYIMDMGAKTVTLPQIFYALRGVIGFELTVKIGETDLHSGVYGNRVINPAAVVSDLMAKMKNIKTGKINIPGFYDRVRKIPQEEIDLLSKYIPDKEKEKREAKVKYFIGDFLSSKIYPGLDINGLVSGYTGEGSKTIIPAWARVLFSVRLVENQEHDEVERMVEKFVGDNMPSQVEWKLKVISGADPFYTDFKNPYAQKTAKILTEVFGGETLFNRSGGSIAAAEVLQRIFKKPMVLTGFTLPDENLHAPDENIDEMMFEKGITALEKILSI